MFYEGVFDNLDGMKYIPVGESLSSSFCAACVMTIPMSVPLDWFMDYVPDVDAFKKQNFNGAPSYVCEVRKYLFIHRSASLPYLPGPGQAEAYEAVLYPAV